MNVNDEFTIERSVDESLLASRWGSGKLDVFATPCMIGFMEEACLELAQPSLAPGEATVGTAVNIEHLKASGVGQKLCITAKLNAIEGNILKFSVEAHDEDGLIGKGTHNRAIIDVERFLRKLNDKR